MVRRQADSRRRGRLGVTLRCMGCAARDRSLHVRNRRVGGELDRDIRSTPRDPQLSFMVCFVVAIAREDQIRSVVTAAFTPRHDVMDLDEPRRTASRHHAPTPIALISAGPHLPSRSTHAALRSVTRASSRRRIHRMVWFRFAHSRPDRCTGSAASVHHRPIVANDRAVRRPVDRDAPRTHAIFMRWDHRRSRLEQRARACSAAYGALFTRSTAPPPLGKGLPGRGGGSNSASMHFVSTWRLGPLYAASRTKSSCRVCECQPV